MELNPEDPKLCKGRGSRKALRGWTGLGKEPGQGPQPEEEGKILRFPKCQGPAEALPKDLSPRKVPPQRREAAGPFGLGFPVELL